MGLSEDDKDWIKLMMREVAFQVNKEVLATHITSCPFGKKLAAFKWILIGVGIGAGVFGSKMIGIGVARILVGL